MKRTLILLAILLLVAGCVPVPAAPAASGSRGLTTGTGIVDTGGEGIKTYAGGAFTAYSDAGSTVTFSATANTGAVVVGGALSVGTFAKLIPATAVVVTAGSTITPAGTFQPLTSTGAVAASTTTGVANGSAAGVLLILQNANASDTITIDGTGANVECKTDIVLGAQDTITLVWNGADWICLSKSDNS